MPRTFSGSTRPTPQVTPSPSAENLNDIGLIPKKDQEKKKDGGLSGSLGKGSKSRLLGGAIGSKLFNKDSLNIEKKSSFLAVPKDQSSLPVETMILFLLSQKANVNARDSYGSTPLHYAVAKGNTEAVSELLTHPGIDIEVREESIRLKTFCQFL